MPKNLRPILGALVGLVSLIAMIRLVSGAFSGGMSRFAWVAILAAMIPWMAYAAWRARHGHVSMRQAAVVLGLCLVGLICVWLSIFGPVLALGCSLAAFVVIWVADWPPRRERGEDSFVRIEELQEAAALEEQEQ